MLDALQRDAFGYFLHETNPANGLVADKTQPDAPASIAAVGFALAVYPVGVERSWMTRAEAAERTLAVLRFFWTSPQGTAPDATGYKGFYYHFLDMKTGRRAGRCELSTIDTAFLLAGMLTAATYFDQDCEDEQEIRTLADALYRRADWQWAQNGGATITHGWKPESGFLKYRWEGYDEALLLYVLGLGSPTYPLPDESYPAWTSTYQWKEIYGHEFLYGSSLFIHQFSHLWIDFRGIQDDFMRDKGIDYFENSRRATHVQQQYAIHNPHGFVGYGQYFWGLTERRLRRVAPEGADTHAGRPARRHLPRRRATCPPQGHDRVRHSGRPHADHVEPWYRSRRDEAHCGADGRRCRDLLHHGAAGLPGHLLRVARLASPGVGGVNRSVGALRRER